jgi:hypothetical protein
MKNGLQLLIVVLLVSLLAACERPQATDEASAVLYGLGPHLAISPNGTAVVSYIAPAEPGHSLQFHVVTDGIWGPARTVVTGENWFVNWADFPSVTPISDSTWAAHWLVRREAGGYAYDIHASISDDAGQTWSTSFLLHSDGTDTEHGFVTLYPAGDKIGAVWLDGRNMAEGAESASGMTLRSAHFDSTGTATNEQIVDDLTCDCCQTDVAITSGGPVAVYRNRTKDEIRDIYISRFIDGAWEGNEAVQGDGWNIAGCPVNGPVVEANGETVVVSWFTAANDAPKIKTAWSYDSGRTFTPPITVADEKVSGYVGSALLSDETVVVSWICKTGSEKSGICYQEVNTDGSVGILSSLETKGVVARMSVPQLANVDDGLLFVWTEKTDEQSFIRSAFVQLH